MGLCLSTTSRLRSTKRTGQSTISDSSLAKQRSPHVVSIHILDDDSLLNIFYLYRPFFLGEDEGHFNRLTGGRGQWDRGRWWYQLVHVCQRWRNLILGSASYLHLSLVCTNGTPVENMLAHSPPLPLTVDYGSEDDITAEDEEGILLALEQRHRLRHLRLVFPVQNLQKLVMATDLEFPILEYLIVSPSGRNGTVLILPETLQAPHLHHLMLKGFACPIRSRLHPTAPGLVALTLTIDHPSAYIQPNVLLQWISFMPQLETLVIAFAFPVPNRDVERQLTHTPITTHITLPNLRFFWFHGVSAYLEAVVCRITTPRLESLQIGLFKQLTFSVPRLAQFMNTTENLRFDNAAIVFRDKQIRVIRDADSDIFGVAVDCWHLDWQVSSMAQISSALSQVFSAVEHLTLRHEVHSQSSEEHNDVQVDRIEWRKLLRSFSNVKTLGVEDGLVEELSRCLRLEDGELPLELLPELQEVTYSGSRDTDHAFTSFSDARQNAGRPVTLVRQSPSPSLLSFESLASTSPGDEAGNYIET
ncbi:hypothetical protein F5888DRAFT_1891233 [Russula emetica]|nr:hypothetical protein F5888DRAFT_1891233 [Russula emetica]